MTPESNREFLGRPIPVPRWMIGAGGFLLSVLVVWFMSEGLRTRDAARDLAFEVQQLRLDLAARDRDVTERFSDVTERLRIQAERIAAVERDQRQADGARTMQLTEVLVRLTRIEERIGAAMPKADENRSAR